MLVRVAPIASLVSASLLSAPPLHSAEQPSVEAIHQAAGDLVCGPRCVAYLLGYYGQTDRDLVELIKEIQYPDVSKGASLAAMRDALSRRGIHGQVAAVSNGSELACSTPAVVHWTAEGRSSEMGHYVVWMPSSDRSQVDFWDGLAGYRSIPTEEFYRHCSGKVMFTSADPAELSSFRLRLRAACLVRIVLLAVAGGFGVCLVWEFISHRVRPVRAVDA